MIDPNKHNEDFVAGFEDGGGFQPPQPPAPLPDIEPAPGAPEPQRHSIPEENFIPSDRFEELNEKFPEVANELKRRKREAESLLKQLDKRDAMLEQAHAKVMEGGAPQKQEPESEWERFSDDQLHDYLDSVEKLQSAAVTNPDNEEIRAELAKIQPKHLRAVRQELSKRTVRSELSGFREEQQQQQKVSVLAKTAEQMIAEQFGPRSLMDASEGTPLHRAKEVVSEVAGKFNITDANPEAVSALAVMAMKLAHAEQASNRADVRAVPPSLTRQLELEGTTRRSASALSERSAMERRGDWDGVLLHDITSMLDGVR